MPGRGMCWKQRWMAISSTCCAATTSSKSSEIPLALAMGRKGGANGVGRAFGVSCFVRTHETPGFSRWQLDTNIHLGRITAHNAVHRRQVAEMLQAPPHDFRAGAVAPTAPHKPAELGDPGDGLA